MGLKTHSCTLMVVNWYNLSEMQFSNMYQNMEVFSFFSTTGHFWENEIWTRLLCINVLTEML